MGCALQSGTLQRHQDSSSTMQAGGGLTCRCATALQCWMANLKATTAPRHHDLQSAFQMHVSDALFDKCHLPKKASASAQQRRSASVGDTSSCMLYMSVRQAACRQEKDPAV